VGPRASLDGGRKSHPPPVFDPWTIQSVANCIMSKYNISCIVLLTRIFVLDSRYILSLIEKDEFHQNN